MDILCQVDHCYVWVKRCPPAAVRYLYQLLSYEEKSSYYQRVVRGWAPPLKRLYDLKQHRFPRGLLERVQTALEQQGYRVQVQHLLQRPQLRPYTIPNWAYPHQVRAVTHLLQHPHSSLQSPTGSGKTAIGAFLLGFIQGRGLMVVPTQDLLFQSAKKIEEILQEPVGLLGAGQCRWERLNVGIINTLVNLKDAPELQEIEATIFDEAHRAIQFSRYGVLVERLTKCYFHWGLTAGAHREDGAELALEAIIGPTKLVISEREVEALGLTVKPRIYFIKQPDPRCVYPGKFKQIGNRRVYDTPNGKPNLQEVYRLAIVENQARNEAVVRVVEAYHRTHDLPVLVLVEAVAHGERLSQMLNCPFIHGGSGKEARLANLEGLRSGSLKSTVASRAYNEGVDIPNLGMVINAAGGCSRQQTRQKVGRGVRQSEGKKGAIIVDFLDEEAYYLRRQAYKRYHTSEQIYPNSCRILTLAELCRILEAGDEPEPVGTIPELILTP